MLALLIGACTSTGGVEDSSASPMVSSDLPAFADLAWSCSAEDDTWDFTAESTAWTAGADLVLTLDGLYVEEHQLQSKESAPDGSWDRLARELDVVADPRDQNRNSTTALLCDSTTQASLALRVALLTPETGEEADCRVAGAELDFEALGYDACLTRWETE